ncbi:MAG: glycosyltransferase [bacterium]
MPKISIIIVTYNRSKYIKEAIQSALDQSFADYELIVIDDGSTDDTKRIVREFQSSKISYYYKSHTNVADSRNYGISKACGEYLVWLDSDDVLMPECLRLELNEIEADQRLDVVYGDFTLIDENGVMIGELLHRNFKNKEELIESMVWNNPIPNVGVMIKKKCYQELGGFDPFFSELAEDYEFWTRAVAKYNFKHLANKMSSWRKHSSALTGSGRDLRFDAEVLRRILAKYDLKELFPWIDWEYQDPSLAKAIAYLNIARIFSYRKADEDSIRYLKMSLDSFPLSESYFRLAKMYQSRGSMAEAKNYLRKALIVNPEHKEAKAVLRLIEGRRFSIYFQKLATKCEALILPCRKGKTVFFVIGFFAGLGGAEKQFVAMVLNRKKEGYRPVVFSYYPTSKDNQYVVKLREEGVRVIAPRPLSSKIIDFLYIYVSISGKMLLPVYSFIKKLKFREARDKLKKEIDYEFKRGPKKIINNIIFYLLLSWQDLFNPASLVHSFRCDFGTELAVTWARRRHVPMIFSERGGVDKEDYYQKTWFYSLKKLKEISRHCIIMVLSKQIRQRAWRVFGPESKVAVIPNCIPDPYISTNISTNQRLETNEVIIGSLGRLSHEKGYDVLIKAIKNLTDKGLKIKCLIGGEGVERRNLELLVSSLGIKEKVSFVGMVSEDSISGFISNNDIFVLPSRTEGMPNSLLYAMGMRKPIIATSVGSVPEVVKDGINAILVPPEEPASLAGAIVKLYNDKVKRLSFGEQSRKLYLEHFTPEVVWPKWNEIYKKLI